MSDGAAQEGPARPTADDVDLRHLLEVLDIALSSDNPAIRDQLQKLLMIATLVSTDKPVDRSRGPLSRIFDEVRDLRQRVGKIEQVVESVRGTRDPDYERMKKAIYDYPKITPSSLDKWTDISMKPIPPIPEFDPSLLKKLFGKKGE